MFWRLFRREAVTSRVFSYDTRNEKVQQIIFTTSLGAAAAHLESAKWMTSHNRTRARAIDIDISRLQLRFDALDVGRAAREKATGQCVVGAVRYFERFIELAHF